MKEQADTRRKRSAKGALRGSQVIFGERRKLQEVLASFSRSSLPIKRKQQENRLLKQLIGNRTQELNSINPGWDRKFALARNPKTGKQTLVRLAVRMPVEDYLLARTLAEHPSAPAGLLESLATHPYSAVRENVARHPNTPAGVLERLALDSHEPLWFLVACNPSIPSVLRSRLKARMRPSARPGK